MTNKEACVLRVFLTKKHVYRPAIGTASSCEVNKTHKCQHPQKLLLRNTTIGSRLLHSHHLVRQADGSFKKSALSCLPEQDDGNLEETMGREKKKIQKHAERVDPYKF
jgi:hypothetical protein